MYKLLVVGLFCVIGGSVGQIVQNGQCDENINLVANFNLTSFEGVWYEIARTDVEEGGDCSSIEFNSVGQAVTVTHTNVKENFYNDYQGQATVAPGTARLQLNLPQISSNAIPFWVLSTNYDNFALTYGCENLGTTQRRVYLWQLGREPSLPTDMTQAALNNIMNSNFNLNFTDLRQVSHSDDACYILPVIEPGQSVVLPGQCDTNVRGIANFQADQFLGVWHQIQSYYSSNAGGTCNRAQYSDGGDRVLVVNSQVQSQSLYSLNGYATVISSDSTGYLNVVLEVLPGVFEESELLVLGTDYRRWAVTYTCVNLTNSTKQVFSWISSRTRVLPSEARIEVDQVINSLIDLNYRYYQTTDQSDEACFYIPDQVSGEPVVFGGQCDLNIPVVANFSPADYMGLWHEIERYPTPFQFGSCNNAFYTLEENGVDVYNTQVLDENLLTINGFAVPVANGKLVVSFPVEGTNTTTETDYWVLSTDYGNYSLVYSCRNINDYQQQVTFWKLSRTKQLTQESATAINNVMSTLPILNQQFFATTNQTTAGCFYYPEPQPGVPVVFPGTCEANVPVVANFNVTRFQGIWHEVEAYPKDPQEGECINHEFSSGTGTAALNFLSSYVDDQLLGTTNGQLTFYPSETGGRFTLSFTSNGTTISFPYYVVATDYENYAVVYSCMNEGTDFRKVFAWKLSRTKQLSSVAETQINNFLNTSPSVVLSNNYFENINQSDFACFYFPNLAPGAPVILPGQCEDLPVMPNLNLTAYLGRWRLIESYPADDQIGQCHQARYTLLPDNTVEVYNNEVLNALLREATGIATVLANGKLSVLFPNTTQPFELTILGTDYYNYSIAYGCTNIGTTQRRIQSWKFSRDRELTPGAREAIDSITSSILVLNDRYYQTVDQSDDACFYYPPIGAGPITFRGQCDQNIPVVTNFDAVGYMGLWHDIESYPVPFQDGDCPNAFYTFDAALGRVDVFNTQVLPIATLDTIEGYATPVPSTDGSAKLEVSFPTISVNLTTPYWVLATDYVNYALVYSCMNIDEEFRTVTSWKLSRTKELNATAETAINNIVNTIPVLDAQYYIKRDHTPEGCFYFPEHEAGKPVVFPGQCDANIPVVSNFNLTLFEGEWFEIEAYPKDPQPGQCIQHEFSSASSSSLSFVSTNVFDELLGTSVGNVALYPNQNDGRLTLSVTESNGNINTFPYYVIATDYNNYALVYSCLNINDDYRGIYAWKLSRTRELAATSITNINNAMTDIDVLSNNYFEPVQQTAAACFYYPDLAPGEAVIIPGQCDLNLPVVTNFDAERYSGRWRLIETYPTDRQIGQCNQAEYTIVSSNTVTVYNNEVVNETLSEITGTATLANVSEAKLTVNFPNQQQFELWILDTDYSNYSLAYGCQNLGNDQRRIWSWKLSRSAALVPEAVAAINTVISNTQGLNNRYYINVDQSDDACFFYPTPGSGPTIFRGQCNENIPVVTNFDAVAYMGLWHDIESYAIPFQDGDCPNAFYSLDSNDGDVSVFNTQVLPGQALDTITGYANVVPSSDGSAKLQVFFPSVSLNSSTPYWVLSTDYTSYSLVYSCVNLGPELRSVSSWKLSRTKELNATAVATINSIVDSIPVLDDQYYNRRDQTPEGCFYFPEPVLGVPVRFPGQCDDSIPVVDNFNMNRFSGVWHEIEAYPKEEQTGDCVNHDFRVNGNTFVLQSNNVIAQSLGVTEGIVSLANSSIAKMTISIVSNGTTIQIPYWIIDTDYDNYAVAYSCVNIDSDYRGVWSWKLSRTQELQQTSNTFINNAIENIDVLGNQYYEKIDQSNEGCFYYPEPTGRPVVFPGQCGGVSPIQNFDAAQYLGTWRIIETYPSDFQLGTCGDATYSLGNGVVDVYNTEVINEALSTINGTAVAATDGTGTLFVTFPTAPLVSEYLILATDYSNFSIVYSCANNSDGETKTVYSWKMSRTNVLSTEAQTAINAVINNIDVLDQRYYQVVNRSAEACFYYPEPNNSTVLFRGQCDMSIPVQANFNATAYMNTWYNIESYPAPFQGGTCGTANYELGDGVVLVVNTQIIDQELDVQTGTAAVVDNAKLAVTFNVSGQVFTTDYWILATDYISYSFVYSCQNINEYYMQVNSFKLSRTKSLTAAAQNSINNVITNVKVLEQRYFVEEQLSDEDCFFYPEIEDGNVILDGQCVLDSQVPALTNFNANQFTGVWHEVSRFPSDLQTGQCSASNFAIGTQNAINIMTTFVENEAQSSSVITGTVASGRGVITVSGAPYEALYILDTDYSDFALAYACRNLPNQRKQIYSWKLARSRNGFSASADANINTLVANNIDLAPKYYYNTEQTSAACFHYPEYDVLPERIELEGNCDESIRGMANFNATAYLGLWREIERYPEPNQFGTCDRAFYSPGDGNVLVRNTQVIQNALLEQTGTASVASTDGSGLLSVDFNVNGVDVNANYYILATDYEDYAFVYSCRNTQDSDGQAKRIVSSWKLSRTDSLSSQALSEISRVINQTQGLNEQYYLKADQSPESCFYIPEVDPNSAPLFRGSCESVAGVSNFNVNNFLGWWNELERYPVDNSIGECINSQYTASGNAFQVVDTSVSTGNGVVATGTVTANQNGVLTKVVNGVTQEIVVLATDYENYALLYSCENTVVNGEAYRRVWSTKHSRTRNIASVRVPEIDNVIATNSVLYSQFYQTVDQSNQACFYYPEVQGQRVILPGQCDENIAVVQSFDVERYGGTWYQIERYPQVHENPTSTCIGARYLLEGDVVSVLNWEVIDGELSTIEGNATLSSTDGSAKLSVVLPVVGTEQTVTTSLYVLATDYENYSLAYSCSNYGPFQRTIGAWKLSRDRVMAAPGTSAINAVIARQEELNQNYFNAVQHNDECPEPSSSVLIKSSVLVMLVCLVVQLLY